MAKMSRSTQIASMPPSYVLCRVVVGNHVPATGYPVVYSTEGGGFEQFFVCENCGAEVSKYRDRHGFVTGGRRYKYQPDYVMQEGGALTRSEKAALFVYAAGFNGARKTTKLRSRRAS
jgi:hypothetical protein